MTADEIREALRARAAEAGISASELAIATGITQPQISKKLAGVRPMRIEEMVAIAGACGMEMSLTHTAMPRPRRGGPTL